MPRRLCVGIASLTAAVPALAQPANDLCSSSQPIVGFGNFFFDTNGATTDGPLEALCNYFGSQQIYNDVWFCWTATASGPTIARTCGGTVLDTKIAVYDGCAPCYTFGGIIGCDDDNCSTQTSVSWTATAGHTYMIRLGSYNVASFGSGALELASGIVAGPITAPSTGHQYYLLAPSSWTAGEAAAIAMGGHLATIGSATENEFLRASVLGFDGQDRRGWIGLNDVALEGTFVWTSGEPVTYTNWSPGEPNNSGGAENYVEMFGSNGMWNDNRNLPTGLLVYPIVEIGPTCYPDCNGDGVLGLADFGCFQTRFALGNSYADCNGDGVLGLADFGCFQTKFALGCP
jgi:hypothetical protein